MVVHLVGNDSLLKKGRGCFKEKEVTLKGIDIRIVKWYDNKGYCGQHFYESTQSWEHTKVG